MWTKTKGHQTEWDRISILNISDQGLTYNLSKELTKQHENIKKSIKLWGENIQTLL